MASCFELLDEIERQEMLSLSWGYVDGSISREAAIKLLKSNDGSVDVEDLLEELIQRRLVFELRGERIRSRFAETIRLLSHLRQLFDGRPWVGAPKLVSDFRVDLRKRRYPDRNRLASAIRASHSAAISATEIRSNLWKALAEKPGLELAGFQERSIERLLMSEPDTGTIVTAGTGSGKTLAFYLPALLRIGEKVEPDQFWVKALAIYPRIELLKDQLAEAFRRARSTDALLKDKQKRPIKVGAYFGSTPNSASPKDIEDKWHKHGDAFICPWMRCPTCDSDLLWLENDYMAQREQLYCSQSECGMTIPEEQLVLTRKRLSYSPPDILFTTTEMLNQRMSDLQTRRLFGIGQAFGRRPIFALLDEVHTYVGTSGAQSALVLRRWRHLLNSPVTWCGLSATLQEAPRFFSDLTGVAADKVVEISPLESELISEGAEYQVVLRGDPLLQASLLSTTIQACMLLGRMMDTAEAPVSKGAFGHRAFVFTDNLDVINRLFDNLRDAEAYNIFGVPDGRRSPLAALRGGGQSSDLRRDADGQRWRAPELIGRTLDTRLLVGRTSSQDAGVLANADVIVATASLEVGYNDNNVGAVIQHKAPRNMASFLQRKGRAGRSRGMRPFTVTILSDYGRDRIAFQAYEHIFDPTLPPQHLPILNQYVLRMQAVYALMDWISADAASCTNSGWMWNLLSRPNASSNTDLRRCVDSKLKQLARGDAATLAALREHLKKSLQITDEIVDSILWSPPRPVMLEAVPTLVRRYFREWDIARPTRPDEKDLFVDFHPLPDFVPRNLFSDLSLPEVQVIIPPATVRHQVRKEPMPIVQALQQLAPGRVTRRFAHERGALCHWVGIDTNSTQQSLSIGTYASKHEYLGTFAGQRASDGQVVTLPVYRPWEIALTQVPTRTVLPTSNASLVWISGFEPRGSVLKVVVPPKSTWFSFVSQVGFYLHRFRGSVAVRRFAEQVQATLRLQTGESLVNVRFTGDDEQSAAVGFEIEVDAFYIDFKLPALDQLTRLQLPQELRAGSRSAYLRYRLLTTDELPEEINSLQREWMYHIFLCAAMVRALQNDISVGVAAAKVLSDRPTQAFSEVMQSLFVLQDAEAELEEDPSTDDGEVDVGASGQQRMSRLEERLSTSLGREDVLAFLEKIAPEFDAPDTAHFAAWMRSCVHETLSEALLQACINTAPKHAAIDTLVADVEINSEDDLARVWVTETTLGGAGVIQAFADTFASEPRSLLRALESAVAPTDLEMTSYGLRRFLWLACDDQDIADLVQQIRDSSDHVTNHRLRELLYEALSRKGMDISHSLSVSLNTRLLRPGTSRGSDELLRKLLSTWESLEVRFGLSIGLREFCFIALGLPDVRAELSSLVVRASGANVSNVDLISVLGGLLWPRGIEIRQRTLQSYNPFRVRRITDPALVRHVILSPQTPTIALEGVNWYDELVGQIADSGVVQLIAKRDSEKALRAAIIKVIGAPVDVGYLQFFPFVERIERAEDDTRVTFSMREQV
jgi:hypothetical protein